MVYVKVKNKQIVDFSPPENFDELSADEKKKAGWISVEDPGLPTFNSLTQRVLTDIQITNDRVVVTYTVVNSPTPIVSVQEQLDSITSSLMSKGVLSQADVTASRSRKPSST